MRRRFASCAGSGRFTGAAAFLLFPAAADGALPGRDIAFGTYWVIGAASAMFTILVPPLHTIPKDGRHYVALDP